MILFQILLLQIIFIFGVCKKWKSFRFATQSEWLSDGKSHFHRLLGNV